MCDLEGERRPTLLSWLLISPLPLSLCGPVCRGGVPLTVGPVFVFNPVWNAQEECNVTSLGKQRIARELGRRG